MRSLKAVTVASQALWLAGCFFAPKPPLAKPPVVTPAAAPARVVPPPPPPVPLSTPQTNVQLPAPQPLSEEAEATTQPPDEPALPPVNPRPATPRKPPAAAPKPAEAPPPAAVPQGPVAEPERERIQEVLPAADLKRFQEEAEDFKRQVKRLLDEVQGQRLNRRQVSLRDYISSFVKQSDEAQARGDMRQAKELAGRALVLAKELQH